MGCLRQREQCTHGQSPIIPNCPCYVCYDSPSALAQPPCSQHKPQQILPGDQLFSGFSDQEGQASEQLLLARALPRAHPSPLPNQSYLMQKKSPWQHTQKNRDKGQHSPSLSPLILTSSHSPARCKQRASRLCAVGGGPSGGCFWCTSCCIRGKYICAF